MDNPLSISTQGRRTLARQARLINEAALKNLQHKCSHPTKRIKVLSTAATCETVQTICTFCRKVLDTKTECI